MKHCTSTSAAESIINEYGGSVQAFVRATNAILAQEDNKKKAAKASAAKVRRRERQRWVQMIKRCHDEKHPAYPHYGGRGIWVHLAWHDFDKFFSDMGPPPAAGMSLDRIDVNLGYTPDNVRWATAREQARNTSRTRDPVVSRIVKDGNEFDTRIDVRLYGRFKSQAKAKAWVDEVTRLAQAMSK
jgi:hypothetical protein